MDVGMILAIRDFPARPRGLPAVYRDYLEDAIYAEGEYGLDFAWTSEHHFAPDGWSPSQLPILSWLAARTSHMRLGTNLLLLPFHHPVRVAEDIATLDILSGRTRRPGRRHRLDRGQFETYAISSTQRMGRLFEALDIIRRCFTEERFDHAGKFFTFPNVRMTTTPVQRPFPLWVGGFGPQLISRAGREGNHLQGGGAHVQAYLDERTAGGHDPNGFCFQVMAEAHLSDSTDQAWEEEAAEGLHHFAAFYQGRDWIPMRNVELPPLPPPNVYRHTPLARDKPVGTPDDVLAMLEPTLRASLVTHFGVSFRKPGMSTEVARRSIDLFGREVLPVIRGWGRIPPVSRAGAVPAAPRTMSL